MGNILRQGENLSKKQLSEKNVNSLEINDDDKKIIEVFKHRNTEQSISEAYSLNEENCNQDDIFHEFDQHESDYLPDDPEIIESKFKYLVSEFLMLYKLTETVNSELEIFEVSNDTFILLEILMKEIEKTGGLELSENIKNTSTKLMEATVHIVEFFRTKIIGK